MKDDIEKKNQEFLKLFAAYQRNLKTKEGYVNFEAYFDLKIIIKLYSEVLNIKGYNYNRIKLENWKQLTDNFDVHRRKDLYKFLFSSLSSQGNDNEIKYIRNYIEDLEIQCALDNIKKNNNRLTNFMVLIHRCLAYNVLTLIILLLAFLLFSSFIFYEAPFEWMECLRIEMVDVSSIKFLNNLSNSVLYLFDFNTSLVIEPTNLFGVIVMAGSKISFVVIVVNYVIKEILSKVKFS